MKWLFVTNKWINGPESPLSSAYENILYTFPQDTGMEYDFLFLDESLQIYGKHIDDAILKYGELNSIDVLVVTRMGTSTANPTKSCLEKLKENGTIICFFWLDSNPWDIQYQQVYDKYIDLNVTWDFASFHGQLYNGGPKHLSLWTPESDLIFYPREKDILVSFIGSLRYPRRADYIDYLQQHVPELVIAGGQREANISCFEYGELIGRSLMTINFSEHGMGYNQVKGRVVQALASQTLLLENINSSTQSFITPNEHYLEFGSKEQLKDLIIDFKNNQKMAKKIAYNGYLKYKDNYTSTHFWKMVIEKIYEKNVSSV